MNLSISTPQNICERKTIQNKSDLKEFLKAELNQYIKPGFRSFFLLGGAAILRRHQYLLRKTEYYANTGKKFRMLLYKIRLSKLQNKHSLLIPLNTCGKGLKIMHLGSILISGRASLGENCALHINTGIVAGGTNDDAPIIGNNVVIGFGAVVLGNVYLADSIAVGANSVVNKSFDEPDIGIAGVPAKKISNNGRSKWGTGTH